MSIKIDVSVKKGDKVVTEKQLKVFNTVVAEVDDVFDVDDVLYDSICLTTDDAKLTVDKKTFNEHFMSLRDLKCVECEEFDIDEILPKNITRDEIMDVVLNSEMKITTVFDVTTIVAAKLPSGFVIVESSSCANPDDYDEEIGKRICIDRIVDKLWELETYRLKCDVYDIKTLNKLMDDDTVSYDDCESNDFEYDFFLCDEDR